MLHMEMDILLVLCRQERFSKNHPVPANSVRIFIFQVPAWLNLKLYFSLIINVFFLQKDLFMLNMEMDILLVLCQQERFF